MLRFAPHAWWLVGLGHLGQAYAWVISWLDYANPTEVEIVLQDTGRTTPSNRSTGLMTPKGSNGVLKSWLVASALDSMGYDTRIIERPLGDDLRVAAHERHVALLGVDDLPTRRLTSSVGWALAVDLGLGSGPDTFSSMVMPRFPGAVTSNAVAAWSQSATDEINVPNTPAFNDLRDRHDSCGVVELAGKAVGAAFVGTVAAFLGVAETLDGAAR